MTSQQHRIVSINEATHNKYILNKISTTKYHLITFIPRFLFEQFRKYANIYFLCIALLQQIPDVSPTGRFTTLVPLCIILSISAIKEIIEDLKRKRSDDSTNRKKVQAMSQGIWKETTWAKLGVGNVVRVMNDEHFPADLVLLSSSEPEGMCYIETSNLDGETNLKVRRAKPQTSKLTTELDLSNCRCTIECENPNKFLYDFVGNIRVNKEATVPLGPDQLLLRGAVLKNTKWIYGAVVYSGFETKLMLNSNRVPLKRSSVDKVVNRQVLMLFCLLLLLSWASAIGAFMLSNKLEFSHWYLGFREDYRTGNILYSLLTFIILYNNLIPISLQVTLEMVKFTQAIFIGWDLDMYYPATETFATARTSNLNEELGQVKYIFSDKTGTLTSNIMNVKYFCVDGIIYGKDFDEPDNQSGDLSNNARNAQEPPDKVDNASNIFEDKRMSYCSFIGEGEDAFLTERIALQEEVAVNTSNSHTAGKKLNVATSRMMDDLRHQPVKDFLIMCSVCHTVVPEFDEEGKISYQAASPDERALVMAAKKVGYMFVKRTPESAFVDINGKVKEYKILNIIDFTSARKRMTVIVQDPSDNIIVMVKGADTVILELLNEKSKRKIGDINDKLTAFSVIGLRTLLFGQRTMSGDEYKTWSKKFYAASTSLKNREENIAEVAELVETNLSLVGISAIEDKLQDGVQECISSLLQAGIKIWVLTGDKQETAINIGMSCKLISPDMNVVRFNETTVEGTKAAINMLMLRSPWKNVKGNEADDALIIDGRTLTFAMGEELRKDFLSVAIDAKVVVCCRVSPSQKAEVVSLVKKECNAITLAIGDGANDVGMIQEAHVGVGISGQEGLQAVCASDYAIAQFRFLKKLLLVHGHWNYNRVTKLILFCFYKNICFYFCEFWYAMLSAFSGQIIFERWTIGLYNVLFTAMPPLAIGIFDQVAPSDFLMSNPRFYHLSQSGEQFNIKVFCRWCLNSIYVSIILFWIPCGAMQHDNVFNDGKVSSLLFVGNIIYTLIIISICLKALLEMSIWNTMVLLLTLGSIPLWLFFLPIYCHLWPTISFAENMVGMDYYMFSSWIFYILLFLVPPSALLKDLVFRTIYRNPLLEGRPRSQLMVSDAMYPGYAESPTSHKMSEAFRMTDLRGTNQMQSANHETHHPDITPVLLST